MPDVPILDTHIHLWEPARLRMPWLDAVPRIGRPYGTADYFDQAAGLPVEGLVFLQAEVAPAYALLEARWVAELARQDPRIKAIVGWAPLEDGEQARSVLEALVAVGPLVKGIRRLIWTEQDLDFCTRPGFVRGVQLLEEYGLSFDLCVHHFQLPAAIELVRQCPRTRFILDHLGKPEMAGGVLDPWRQDMRALARLPNVVCKVSLGMMGVPVEQWSLEQTRPYVEHAIEVFGEDRVAFASNWPVLLLEGSIRDWVAALDRFTSGMSATARRKLWGETGRAFYRVAD